MQINRWHRLWVLGSFLTLIGCAFYVYTSWPDEQSIPHSTLYYDRFDSTARSQIAEVESVSNIGIRMPNGHIILLKPKVTISRKTEALVQYQEAVLAELHAQKLHLVIDASIFWVTISIASLFIGHLLAWVILGFEETNKELVTGNFIFTMWNGDAGLPKTYWVYGIAMGFFFGFSLLALKPIPGSGTAKFLLTLVMVYYTVVYVGIWRAANKYQGKTAWAKMAKSAVVLGTICILIPILVGLFK